MFSDTTSNKMDRAHFKRYCPGHRMEKKNKFVSQESIDGHIEHKYFGNMEYQPSFKLELPRWLFVYICVGILAVLCYVNNIEGGFVHDDVMAIRKNQDVHGMMSLREVFRNDFWGKPMADRTSHKSYRPLTVVTFRLNHWLGQLDPRGYHLTNNVLHVVTCLLFTWFCHKHVFPENLTLILATGALFAVHPVHTEAVSGLVGRADMLAAIFFLLTLITYHWMVKTLNASYGLFSPWLILTLLFSVAAMLCKEHGITVLAVCSLCDIFKLSNHIRSRKKQMNSHRTYQVLLRLTVLIGWICLVLTARLCLIGGGQYPEFQEEDSPASFHPYLQTRVMTYVYIWAVSGWLIICPVTLSHDWQMGSVPLITSVWDARNLASLLLVLILLALAGVCLKGKKILSRGPVFYGLVLTVIPYLPACHVFIRVGFVIAERVLYIPSMGVVILVVHCIDVTCKLLGKHGTKMRALLVTYLLVFYSMRTLVRNQVWKSGESLALAGLGAMLQNAKMHYNYANIIAESDDVTSAVHHYEIAIELWPDYVSAHNNVATLLRNTTEAELHLEVVLRLQPCHSNALTNLANIYFRSYNNTEEALKLLHKAETCGDRSPRPHASLAAIYEHLGFPALAEMHHLIAVQLAPQDHTVHHNAAVFYQLQGRSSEALRYLQRAVQLNPENHLSLRNLARLYSTLGRHTEAKYCFNRALKIQRDHETLDMAGTFYFNGGDLATALGLFREAYNIHQSENYIIHLAQCMSRMELYTDAEMLLSKHLADYPGSVQFTLRLTDTFGLQDQHHKAHYTLVNFLSQYGGTLSQEEVSTVYQHLGNHAKDQHMYNTAVQYYSLSVAYNKDNVISHHNLAVYYHQKGLLNVALLHYESAVLLNPGDALLQSNYKILRDSLHRSSTIDMDVVVDADEVDNIINSQFSDISDLQHNGTDIVYYKTQINTSGQYHLNVSSELPNMLRGNPVQSIIQNQYTLGGHG